MSRIRTSMVLFLIALVALNQTSAEYETKAQKSRFKVASLHSKTKELTKPSCRKGRQEQHLDETLVYKITFSLEMGLYCLALLVAICHLGVKKPQTAYADMIWDEENPMIPYPDQMVYQHKEMIFIRTPR